MFHIGASELEVAFGAGSFFVTVYGVVLARRQLKTVTEKSEALDKKETLEAPTSKAS